MNFRNAATRGIFFARIRSVQGSSGYTHIGLFFLAAVLCLSARQGVANTGALTLTRSSPSGAQEEYSIAKIVPPAFDVQAAQPVLAPAAFNQTSYPAMPIFPQDPKGDEMTLDQDITPVSEPGTWIVASLVSAFLIWKRRVIFTPDLR